MICCTVISSPLGPLALLAEGDFLTGLLLNAADCPPVPVCPELPVFVETEQWLRCFWEGRELPLPPMRPAGTAFQKTVWAGLCRLRRGQTVSYGQLALDCFGSRRYAQAVGQAVGNNPIPILIPCHRVIGADGKLTGYSGGLGVKKRLLQYEGLSFPL